LTKTQIITAVRGNLGDRDDKDTIISTGLSLALEDLTKDFDWRQLESIADTAVSAEAEYILLPENWLTLKEVRLMNGLQSYILPLKNRVQVLRDYPDADTFSSSYPECCYIQNNELHFAPRTSLDATIRLTYTLAPDWPTDDEALVPAINGLTEYFIAYATSWVYMSMTMFREASTWMSVAMNARVKAQEQDSRIPAMDWTKETVQTLETSYEDPTDPFAGRRGGLYGT
jgi:hypothetical protein